MSAANGTGRLTPEALATALLAHATAPSRLALSKTEAARSLGVSVDFFEQHVQPHLRVIRKGRKALIPTAELERWVSENAHQTQGAGS
jgi:excisionase family DNA binding protein